MIFLNPGILLGLLAASIPVLIHLLNLRKLKRIEFSTLSFLKELQKTKIRRIKLKQWILLILRTLIILFIVLSFARPTIKSLSLAGVSSAAKTTAVFILDNSFSMSVITERGSYFNQAKKQINIALENLKGGDEAILLLTSEISESSLNTVTNLPGLKKSINDTEISFISGPLHSQISKAFKILSESNNYNKEIYVFSDFQSSRLTDVPGEKPDTVEYSSENVRMYLFNLAGKDIVNYSVSDFRVTNQIFEQNKPIGFSATLTNNSGRNVKNLVASLFLDGRRIAQKSADLDPGQSKILQFETTLKKSGLLEYFIEIEDDEILQDNRRFVSISVPDKISLVFFTDDENDSKYVETALMDSQGNNHILITRKSFRELTAINLDNFDAVFIIGSGSLGDYNRIQTFVNNGGQLIIMPGSSSNVADFRLLTGALNLPEPSVLAGSKTERSNFLNFEKIAFNHPLFSNLFENKFKKEVESPKIYQFFKFGNRNKGRDIITLIDNSPFLSEYILGQGRILLFNVAPVLSWSNFPLKGLFAPLLTKTVFYLTSQMKDMKEFITGDKISVILKNNSLGQIKISRPNNLHEFVNIDTIRTTGLMTYSNTDLSGTYKFYSADKLFDFAPVNTNPLESVTNYMNEENINMYLKEIYFRGIAINISPDENFVTKIEQSRFGTELWKLFLIMALLLALTEMIIARSTKKDLAEIK